MTVLSLDQLYEHFGAAQARTGYAGITTNPAVETTEEAFWYFLEVMWPRDWRTVGGIERFMVDECVTHQPSGAVYSQFARIGQRYFQKYVVDGAPETYITKEALRP